MSIWPDAVVLLVIGVLCILCMTGPFAEPPEEDEE